MSLENWKKHLPPECVWLASQQQEHGPSLPKSCGLAEAGSRETCLGTWVDRLDVWRMKYGEGEVAPVHHQDPEKLHTTTECHRYHIGANMGNM